MINVLRVIGQHLLALTRKKRLDNELDGEVEAHLELLEQDLIAAGMAPAEARMAALRNFGGIEQMKEIHREVRGYPWIEGFVRDFRYGLISLKQQPGFATVAIAVLALGIGANTAMFSIIDAVLWKPLPFPDPDRIVRVWETPDATIRNSTSTLTFLDWKHLDTVFDAVSVDERTTAAITTGGVPERLSGSLVSADYFKVFGVQAGIGRTFTPLEDQPGSAPVVVLSNALWKSRFASDPDILNRELVLDGEANRIVGVMPAGVFDRETARYWKPLIFAPEQMTRGSHWLDVIGRLRPGVSLEEARARLTVLRASLAPQMAAFKKNWGFTAEPFEQRLVGDNMRRAVYLGFAAVLMVLLIACSNVANLLLTKGAARRKEMALRAALGASRGRLVAQLLVEAWVLCLLGSAAGLAVAYLLLQTAGPVLAPYLPFTAELRLDWRVLSFAAAAAVGTSLLVGVLPALQTSFSRLTEFLNQGSRGSSGSSAMLRRTIVVGEVALSLVLLCGASLLFRSLVNLQRVDAGVRIENVITASIDLPLTKYPTADSATSFYRSVIDRVQAVPGVERAALSQDLPLEGVHGGELFGIPGQSEILTPRFKRIDAQYLAALDIPVIAGRGITDHDRADSPRVVLINEELARALATKFGIHGPAGRMASISSPGYGKQEGRGGMIQIAGVIRNERTGDLNAPLQLVMYVPLAQYPRTDVKLIARTTLQDPSGVVSAIREAVRQIDPNLPLADVKTMKQIKQQSLSSTEQPTWLIGCFAAIAALLAALGLYGVIAHSVVQQRKEIGIRMALGASSRVVLSQILSTALKLTLTGLMIGMLGSFAITRLMKTVLFEVSPLDPYSIAIASISMITIGVLAGLIPASRASRVDPVTTLRAE